MSNLNRDSPIKLQLTRHRSTQGISYQELAIDLTSPDRVIASEDLIGLELPPGVDTTGGVVISGRAPIWLYAYLVHELHPTNWVACFDPRLSGGVVVATHSKQVQIGQVIRAATTEGQELCPALVIVGPPDSGKSVLSHALFQALLVEDPDIYLQRANWDGEGNWVLELNEDEDTETLKMANKGKLTEEFFPYQSQAILALRKQKSLVIVDVGGKVQPEKQPILEACSHYLIISSDPAELKPWHEFCRDRGNLTPVAVIHSSLEDIEQVTQLQPYLDMTCGAWVRGKSRPLPEVLLERVRSLLLKRT